MAAHAIPTAATNQERTYLLPIWPGGISFKSRGMGITPNPHSLSFVYDDRTEVFLYKRIREINLTVSHIPRSADIARASIRFNTGLTIIVQNTNKWGAADQASNDEFYAFIADLHQRIITNGAASEIQFTSGFGQGRITLLKFTLVIAAAFFVVLPLVLFFITGEMQALFILLAGAALVYPVYRTLNRNTRKIYNPAEPPILYE